MDLEDFKIWERSVGEAATGWKDVVTGVAHMDGAAVRDGRAMAAMDK